MHDDEGWDMTTKVRAKSKRRNVLKKGNEDLLKVFLSNPIMQAGAATRVAEEGALITSIVPTHLLDVCILISIKEPFNPQRISGNLLSVPSNNLPSLFERIACRTSAPPRSIFDRSLS